MAMYCFCRCFLYPRTECIMSYGAVWKFYQSSLHFFFCPDVFFFLNCKLLTYMLPISFMVYWQFLIQDKYSVIHMNFLWREKLHQGFSCLGKMSKRKCCNFKQNLCKNGFKLVKLCSFHCWQVFIFIIGGFISKISDGLYTGKSC